MKCSVTGQGFASADAKLQQPVECKGTVSAADVYLQHEAEEPSGFASTGHSKSNVIHKIRKDYSGGTPSFSAELRRAGMEA